MKFLSSRLAASSVSLGALALACVTPLQGGCSSTTINNNGNATDSGVQGDTGSGDDVSSPLSFAPSNVSLGGMDLSTVADEDVTGECSFSTDTTVPASSSCFQNAAEAVVAQSDGTKVHVFVVKSLRVEATAHVTVDAPAGGLPLVIIALGNIAIFGAIDVGATGDTAYGGGFQSTAISQKGAGPGGGPPATGVGGTTQGAGAGGGSYCGLGGQGALEAMATGAAGASAPAYGTAALSPLVGGSSGGAGTFGAGAGGGAVQLVAGGNFTMAAGSYINVGGGGGKPAVSSNFGDNSGGGGSGGAILIEATAVQIAGTLAANGGGGGGVSSDGFDGTPDAVAAAGGTPAGAAAGGAGGAGTLIDGASPVAMAQGPEGGGGGGVGRIRINTMGGAAVLAAARLSPAATTSCVTQGTLHPRSGK
jgi:hypothetical protein